MEHLNVPTQDRKKLNPLAFWPAFILLLIFVVVSVTNLDSLATAIEFCRVVLQKYTNWAMLFFTLLLVLFLFGLCFSPIGNIRLGGKHATPDFTIWQWFTISLCSCIGSGMLFWGTGEPIFHFMQPPAALDLVSQSREAAIFAISQTTLHVTFGQYSIYTSVGVAIALVAYNMNLPLSVSAPFYTVVKGPKREGLVSFIHFMCLLALCCAVGCSAAAAIMQISGGIGYVLNLASGPMLQIIVAFLLITLYTTSAMTGIKNGMRVISNIKTTLLFFFMIFILFMGPTTFILNLSTEALGYFINTFFRNSTLMNTFIEKDTWTSDWTAAYLAGQYIFAPLLGLYLARLARGRTVRQFILVNVLAPTLFCFIWISIFGGVAIFLQHTGGADIWHMVSNGHIEQAIYTTFNVLPASKIMIGLFTITCIFSIIAMADPITTALATISTKGTLVNEEAPNRLKLIWGPLAGIIGLLLAVTGGINAIRGIWTVMGVPMMILVIALIATIPKNGLKLFRGKDHLADAE